MGVASYLDLRTRLAIPDTPPEILTPDTSSYSSRYSEERSWNPPAPLSPPMSNYDPSAKAADMSAGKGPGEAPVRREAASDQAPPPPRQQLPSLSSLFGPPPPVRPFHSPVSDRPGPPYASNSPLDRPFGPATSQGRASPSSYLSPVTTMPPISQPRSAPEPLSSERHRFPPLSQAFAPPSSPLYQDSERQQRPPDTPSSFVNVGKWSARPKSRDTQADRSDSQTYKSSNSYSSSLPPSRHGEESGRREQPAGQSSGHVLPKTPDSTGEIVLSKDGLGPKIWTGTHFLPRFVRAAEVPGEGMCYFYDDGSHCKTVIDGEAVNAHWGVTKAGKPRKRLAIACVTCREKKIKCDPDYPRCVQCEKFGRVCTFKNAPRGGHNTSPSTPPAEPEDTRRLGPMIRPPPEYPRPGSHSSESMSPRVAFRPASPDHPGANPPKRMRMAYDHYVPTTAEPRSPMAPKPEAHRPLALSWPELPRMREDALCRAWQTDPYVSNPQSVSTMIHTFFRHSDALALRFLPEQAFMTWVKNSAHQKSPEDLMLVYSILAVCQVLEGANVTWVDDDYSQVARYAVDHGALSLQLVQARLLLSLFYLGTSRQSEANDMLGSAISAATFLQLHLDLEKSRDTGLTTFPFGLTRAGYVECRTRTFWCCYLLERLNGLFPTRPAILNDEDIFLRLPADVTSLEEQRAVATPAFEPYFSSRRDQPRGGVVGMMGYLVELVSIWGDVMTSISRFSHRASSFYNLDFSTFHRDIMSRLDDWKSSLPTRLDFPSANLSSSSMVPEEEEDWGTLLLMYLVFHMTMVKLHRHAPVRLLPPPDVLRYALVAQDHAWAILDVAFGAARHVSGYGSPQPPPPPFTSLALLEATDVLSAEGGIGDLERLVAALAPARALLTLMGRGGAWRDTAAQQMAMERRLDMLRGVPEHVAACGGPDTVGEFHRPWIRVFRYRDERGQNERGVAPGWRWQMLDALETRFSREMDCVYTALTGATAYA
ncbi:hypothetical protein QBC47DRAFT_20204 [Echria macrotheca]|uniref:Zn(2)-C6 fungal-type domain-containing protein n=1 Tax=Echria macrotheca TaxID=438768 RepID=A0AAJ0BMI7_9PEZI|nr:hypothetical protein QBC47DRAFT_20204 [Echria macrotheca]